MSRYGYVPPKRKFTCHWPGCTEEIARKLWACGNHMRKLPPYLKRDIEASYMPNESNESYRLAYNSFARWFLENQTEPVRIITHCPKCKEKHIDEGMWEKKPHKTHLCLKCGISWKPFPYFTVGVTNL